MSIPSLGTPFRTPVTVQMTRPTRLVDSMKPSFLDRSDVSDVGGAVVGGVWGYTIGSSIGGMFGTAGAVLLGAGGAYYLGNWGYGAGLKNAACIAGGSIVLGHLGSMAFGPIGGIAGSIGGAWVGAKVANKIGNKQA
jgi:hypothetical protein